MKIAEDSLTKGYKIEIQIKIKFLLKINSSHLIYLSRIK